MKPRDAIANFAGAPFSICVAMLLGAMPVMAYQDVREQELDRLVVNLGVPETARRSLDELSRSPELQSADPKTAQCILNVYSALRITAELRAVLAQATAGSPHVADLNRFYESSAGRKLREAAVAAVQHDAATGESTQHTFTERIAFTPQERAQMAQLGESGMVPLMQRVQQSVQAAQAGLMIKLQDEALRTCSGGAPETI